MYLSSVILTALLAAHSEAYVNSAGKIRPLTKLNFGTYQNAQPSFFVKSSTYRTSLNTKPEEADDEIERLRSMAAKLRAEAAALEAEQAKQMADTAERVFRKFDTNQDGTVSFRELKEGLEKEFKTELPEKRVQKLMEDFDKTGTGVIQLDEFVTLDKFRNRLDQLAREEKAMASEMAKKAKAEDDLSKFLQAQMDMINDRPPSNTDRLVSILPYLFPLLDGIQYARFFILDNPDNIFSIVLALFYALYRSIPFGGFIAFFALSFLSGNPTINRLVRFNMQQAIFIDIALIFPGLISALYSFLPGSKLPIEITALGNDLIFVTLIATIGYSVVSSLLGQAPNKIPFISGAVESRMPTIDMFDAEGRFNPRNARKKDDDDKKKD